MKVGQLLELLSNFDDDVEVLIAEDSDTIGFKELDDEMSFGTFSKIDGKIEFGVPEINEELARMGFDEDDIVIGDEAIVLYLF